MKIIDNRDIISIICDRIGISKMEMLKKDENDFKNFKKVILLLSDMPFEQYDIEYVIQNREVILTIIKIKLLMGFLSF